MLNNFLNENYRKSKLKNVLELGVLLESPRQIRFYRFYFIIFRPKVWKILNF